MLEVEERIPVVRYVSWCITKLCKFTIHAGEMCIWRRWAIPPLKINKPFYYIYMLRAKSWSWQRLDFWSWGAEERHYYLKHRSESTAWQRPLSLSKLSQSPRFLLLTHPYLSLPPQNEIVKTCIQISVFWLYFKYQATKLHDKGSLADRSWSELRFKLFSWGHRYRLSSLNAIRRPTKVEVSMRCRCEAGFIR